MCGCGISLRLYSIFHAQPSIKFILLLNVKVSTIVGILTSMSGINTTSESFEARNIVVFSAYHFKCRRNIMVSSDEHERVLFYAKQ